MIVDTTILYGLADRRDPHHAASKDVFAAAEERVVCEPCLVEADFLILRRLGIDAELAFLRSLGRGAFVVENPGPADRARAAEIASHYRDLRVGYVDAVTIAIAERLGETRIATADRRHFAAVQPRHAPAFELIP